jgi:hypothetical protein
MALLVPLSGFSYANLGAIREEFADPGSRFNPGFLGRIEH